MRAKAMEADEGRPGDWPRGRGTGQGRLMRGERGRLMSGWGGEADEGRPRVLMRGDQRLMRGEREGRGGETRKAQEGRAKVLMRGGQGWLTREGL